jgi:hypothetical protein
MTDAARDSRYWNDMWTLQDEQRRERDRKVALEEVGLMEEEEEHSEVMNRVWRRVGRATDYTRAFLRAQRLAAAGGPPVARARTHEDEATAEREAVRQFFVERGVLEPLPAAPAGEEEEEEEEEGEGGGGAGGEGDDAFDDAYDGEVERGRNGWVSLATEEGFLYYCNDDTGVTQWERPEDF